MISLCSHRILASLLFTVFYWLTAEGIFRPGKEQKSLQRGAHDRGSTTANFYFLIFSMLFPYIFAVAVASGVFAESAIQTGQLQSLRVLHCEERVAWGLMALMLSGALLRFWSMRTLGTAFSRTLKIQQNQRIIKNGPYRILRHPGYAANLLIFPTNSLLVTGNVIVSVVIIFAYIFVYRNRINKEEDMLRKEFGSEYENYMKRTWRLIPLVY